jgi:hypothetical protein
VLKARQTSISLLLLSLVLAIPAWAEKKWTLRLSKSGNAITTTPGGGLNASEKNIVDPTTTTLTVTCEGLECTTITAAQVTGESSVAMASVRDATAQEAHFSLDPAEVKPQTRLQVSIRDQETPVFDAPLAPAGTSRNGTDNKIKTLHELLTSDCPVDESVRDREGYDLRNNILRVVVSPTGNVLGEFPDAFDEDDVLEVIVHGDARLLPALKVVRKSAFRQVGGISILGAGVAIPKELLERHAAEDAQCQQRSFFVRDFAPGKGLVEIRAVTTEGEVTTGSLEFAVHRLYTGMFSLGALQTDLVDPEFTLTPSGSQSVITPTEQGSTRILYALFYTPFVWGKRDIEKNPRRLIEHLNPTVGIVLNDVADNALAGFSVDVFNGFVVTGGWHLGHIHVLQGYHVGDVFNGTAAQIPVAQKWDSSGFFAVSVDLRAAVELLGSAFANNQ